MAALLCTDEPLFLGLLISPAWLGELLGIILAWLAGYAVVQGWVAGDVMWMISHGGLVQGSVAAKCSIALALVAAICSLVCCLGCRWKC